LAASITSTLARPFTVVFNSSNLPANAAAIVQAAGGKVVGQVPEIGVLRVEGPSSLLGKLSASPAVRSVGPTMMHKLPSKPQAKTFSSFDTSGADLYNLFQWDIKQVTSDGTSFNICAGSHRTVVGVVDTGINTKHQDLVANLLGGRNFVPDDPYAPGSLVDPAAIEDLHGHGSHTAGTVAGKGLILGVGPNLGLRAYRVLTAEGWGYTDWIIGGMVAAANDGVDVISMSIGGYDCLSGYTWTDPVTGTVYKLKDVADMLAWKRAAEYVLSKGVVLVVAAGNSAIDIGNPATVTDYLNEAYGSQGYHFWGASREVAGTVPHVITVSATGPDTSLSSYSNFGPGAIDLSAPGGDFLRYPVGDWYTDMCLSAFCQVGGDPNWYNWMAGTSMATPKVAAVAALIIDQAKAKGNTLRPSQITALLQQSSIDLGKPGYDPFYGFGMVNAVSALTQK
jgi:subtilisin family serine protease